MLISIGRALSQERNIESLLATIILRRACEVTNADAGSVYVVEGHRRRRQQADDLRFAASQNDSRTIEQCRPASRWPVSSTSIVGTLRAVRRADQRARPVRGLDEPGTGNNPWGFVHDRSFDDQNRYQTRSVLAVPMISARDEVIGVIQLINKRAKGWIALDLPGDFENGVVAVRRDLGDLHLRAGVAGRDRARERPSLRRGQDAVRRASSRPRSARSSRAIRRRRATASGSPG